MRKRELIAIAQKSDTQITICNILEHNEGCIKFVVDPGLAPLSNHLPRTGYNAILQEILQGEQIDHSIAKVVTSSFKGKRLSYIGSDAVYQCILKCFAEHRPLTLSPDIIWLLIAQAISTYINRNAEKLRQQFVSWSDQQTLTVVSKEDILTEETDWQSLLQDFHRQIREKTKTDIADSIKCDFSTTQPDEAIASIATLMGSVQSYFHYVVSHYICGIPYVTLHGTPADWEKVLKKAAILPQIGLQYWYEWLEPILREFVRTANGKPNQRFWRDIVVQTRSDTYHFERSCIPNNQKVDGWFIALFPFSKDGKNGIGSHYATANMPTEFRRVPFVYLNDVTEESFAMELWSGFIGVEEDLTSRSLTPQIGWFVRHSDVEEESFQRLVAQDKRYGIYLDGDEIPELLKRFERIRSLTIDFHDRIVVPTWLDEIPIERFTVYGKISPAERSMLKARFKGIEIIQ